MILPRQGGGARSVTEGAVGDDGRFVPSPSDAFGATSPWRGRIGPVALIVSGEAAAGGANVSWALKKAL